MKRRSQLTLKQLEKKGQLKGTFWGYASTYTLDQGNDQILPGAFSATLAQWKQEKNRYPHLYWDHDFEEVIGICQEMREDEHGLYVKGKLLLDIPKAVEAYLYLEQGINGLSIGFYPVRFITKNGIRYIAELTLKEVSFVDAPCNPEAEIYEYKKDDLRQALARLKKTLTS